METKVEIIPRNEKITIADKVTSFGSCFSTEIGKKMTEAGFKVSNNPFGVLFNPASIASSISRLMDGPIFSNDDVIDRDPLYGTNVARRTKGDDASLPRIPKSYASFYHHSSFAAPSPEEFLLNANTLLREASAHFASSRWVIVTFGTSWVFRHIEKGIIVSNCHKRPAYEFRREALSVEEIYNLFAPVIRRSIALSAKEADIDDEGGSPAFAPKRWIFTVSPIRHLADTLHGNQLSKATLLLAVDHLCREFPNACYFPSYEIVLDELRDYRHFAEDGVHPSQETINFVWSLFRENFTNN